MTIHYEGAYHRGLPKWPAIVVMGERVTPEQAAEIIIRTDYHIPEIWGNDKHYARQVSGLFGIPEESRYPGKDVSKEEMDAHRRASRRRWQALDRLRDKLGCIPLEYLNHDRILSAYIGGTNGWVNWNGTVGLRGKNIGKWPEIDTVAEEWHRIAQAFPYLKLRCQLFDGENCEMAIRPVVHYIVQNGDVTVRDSNGVVLEEPQALDMDMDRILDTVLAGTIGRGTDLTIDSLKEKLEGIYGTIPQYQENDDD